MGEGKLIFQSEETHVLCLHQLSSGEIYAGTGTSGCLYLLKPQGKAYLIFDSGYEEIKDIVTDDSGIIYIAAAGTATKAKKVEVTRPAVKASSSGEVSIVVAASDETRPSALFFGF